MRRILRMLPVVAFVFMSASKVWWSSIRSAAARTLGGQQSGTLTTQYQYDANGRLTSAVMPNDTGVFYKYDAAGNLTSVTSGGPQSPLLIDFAPEFGIAGTVVTFNGFGFSAGVTSVSFNGTPASSFTVTPPNVVATVAAGTTTGDVIITTQQGSVTTSVPFIFIVPGPGS